MSVSLAVTDIHVDTCRCCNDSGKIPGYGVCPLCDGFGLAREECDSVQLSVVHSVRGLPSLHGGNRGQYAKAATKRTKTLGVSALSTVGGRGGSAPVELLDPTAVKDPRQVVLPVPGERNILITAALPYVNNVPHLGNIIGCVLSADVYARYCRSRGYRTLFIGGTDEYGTATEFKAIEEGLTPREICDKYHVLHAQIYEWFGISFDHFGRTSTALQTEIVQSIYHRVYANGLITENTTEQLYSEKLGRFLADRFVEGTCPKCGYTDARGDQCDKCTTLLDASELIRPRCKVTGTTPVLRTTKHLYLDLPRVEERLSSFVDTKQREWSANAQHVTAAWLRDGLKPRCITRDLKWGVPVPQAGFQDKVFYVWFDAPVGYVSITAGYTQEWQRWWRAPQDVELVQFLGKDNIPFHTVIFPASLLATGDTWTLIDRTSVTEYLTYEGGKFSKSRKTGIFGDAVSETGIPADVFRYYLLSVRPEKADADFRWHDLAARNNSELSNNLGNFCHRALDFVGKKFGGVVVGASESAAGVEVVLALGREAKTIVDRYISHLEKSQLRKGLETILEISALGNKFLQDNTPWKELATNPDKAAVLYAGAVGLVRLLASLLSPFLPTVAGLLLQFLGLRAEHGTLSDELLAGIERLHELVPPGHTLGPKSQPLFDEITPEHVERLRKRFAGDQ